MLNAEVTSEEGDRFTSYAHSEEVLFEYIEVFHNQHRHHSTRGELDRSANRVTPRKSISYTNVRRLPRPRLRCSERNLLAELTMPTLTSNPHDRFFRLSGRIWLAVGAVAEAMTFLEHLDELRKRLLWSVLSVVTSFAICWTFADDLYNIAAAPIRSNPAVTLAVGRPQDIFSLWVKVTLVASLFLAAPLVLLQAWLFISPGLHSHERRWAIPFVLSGSVLFAAGGAFGYFVAFPMALSFLLDWITAAALTPIIDAVEYFDLFFSIVVALGLVFQIPAVIFVLSRIGLVTASMLAHYFRHAVLAAVVLAAILTPTTDFGNMLILAGPMVVLYAVGIGVAWVFGKRREP